MNSFFLDAFMISFISYSAIAGLVMLIKRTNFSKFASVLLVNFLFWLSIWSVNTIFEAYDIFPTLFDLLSYFIVPIFFVWSIFYAIFKKRNIGENPQIDITKNIIKMFVYIVVFIVISFALVSALAVISLGGA